jgi:hypothetical protein
MPKIVQAGQDVIQFPDDMDDEAISQILRKEYPPAAKERSLGETAYDVGQDLNIAASRVFKQAGTMAGLVVPGIQPENALTRSMDSEIKQSEEAQSPYLQQKRAASRQRVAEAEKTQGQVAALKQQASELTDPTLLGSELTQLIPQFVPAAAAGRAAAAIGAGTKAVMAWVIGTGAGQQAADTAGDVYREAKEQGHSDNVAMAKAQQAAMAAVPISVGSQFAFGQGGRAVERFLVGQKTGNIVGKRIIDTVTRPIKTGAAEGSSEIFEEEGSQLIKNIQAGAPLERGAGATIATAGILGAVPGGAAGLYEAGQRRGQEAKIDQVIADITAVGEANAKLRAEETMGPPEPKAKRIKQEQLNLELPLPEGTKFAEAMPEEPGQQGEFPPEMFEDEYSKKGKSEALEHSTGWEQVPFYDLGPGNDAEWVNAKMNPTDFPPEMANSELTYTAMANGLLSVTSDTSENVDFDLQEIGPLKVMHKALGLRHFYLAYQPPSEAGNKGTWFFYWSKYSDAMPAEADELWKSQELDTIKQTIIERGDELMDYFGLSWPEMAEPDIKTKTLEDAVPLSPEWDSYENWITNELAASDDRDWFQYATRKIGQWLTQQPKFGPWYKNAFFKNKDGSPVIWVHGTAQNIDRFRPKQADAVFMTQSPAFSSGFQGSSENWMVQNIEKVLPPEALQLFIQSLRHYMYDKLKKENELPSKVRSPTDLPWQQLKLEEGYHRFALEWLPSRANSMALVTNVKSVWDYEKSEDIERLIDVLPYSFKMNYDLSDLRYRLSEGNWRVIEEKPVRRAIEDLGFEGFFMSEGGEKNLGIFNNKQVKSATGNNGEFDPDQDIIAGDMAWKDFQTKANIAVVPIFEETKTEGAVVPGVKELPIGSYAVINIQGSGIRVVCVKTNRRARDEDGRWYHFPTVTLAGDTSGYLHEVHPSEIVRAFVVPSKMSSKGVPLMQGNMKETVEYLQDLLVKGEVDVKTFGSIISQLHQKTAELAKDKESSLRVPMELFDADGLVDIKEAVKWLTTDPKILEERPDLAAIIGLIADAAGDLKIRLAKDEAGNNSLYALEKKNKANLADYNSQKHEVRLGLLGLHPSTLVHEIAHGVTYRILLRYFEIRGFDTSPRIPINQMPQAIQELHAMFEKARAEAGFYAIDSTVDGKTQKIGHWTLGPSWQYGLMNLGEFVVEGMMNRTFQLQLAKLEQVEKPTWTDWLRSRWGTFIALVGEMIGLEVPAQSLLAQFIRNFSDVVDLQLQKNDTLAKELDKIYNSPGSFREVAPQINLLTGGLVAASEAVQQAEERGIEPRDEHTAAGEVIERTLGQEGLYSWLPEDPLFDDERRRQILSEVDGSEWKYMYPGAVQAAEVRRSTLIGHIFRLMDNAYKRAEMFNRTYIKPLELLWNSILRDQKATRVMHAIFIAELKASTRFTEAQLATWLTPKQVDAYMAMRGVLDETMALQEDALLSVGLKPVTPLDAYLAARWSGPWRSVIRNAEGKIIWVIAEKTKGKAQKAMNWIRARNPGMIAEEITFYKGAKNAENKLQAGYAELLKMLDLTDPDTKALREAWERAMIGDSENILGQEKHFKRKTGVRGYQGDRPWVDSYEDARDMFIEQFKYMKAAATWSHMQVPLQKAKQVLTDPEINLLQPNNVQYATEYLRNYMGYGTADWVSRMEESMSEFFKGIPTGTVDMVMGTLKTAFYITALGYNAGYMIYALLQPMLGAGKHARLTTEGFNHNIGKTLLLSLHDGFLSVIYHALIEMGKYLPRNQQDSYRERLQVIRKGMSYHGARALDYMEDNGVISMSPHTDIQELYVPTGMIYARRVLGATTVWVETISRSLSFYSFVHHLAQSGKMNENEVLVVADDSVKDVMGDYRPNERALIFEKAGMSGKALATLQTFKFNWLSQVVKYSKMGWKEGNWRPFLCQMSMYLILSGSLGLVGADDADDIYFFFLSMVPPELFNEMKNYSPKSYMMRNMPDWMAYGAVGYATGTNIHTRGSLGDILPYNPQKSVLENVGNQIPFLGTSVAMAAGVYSFGKEMMGKGNPDENAAAMYKAMPSALKGPMEVQSDMFNYGGMGLSTADPELGVYQRDESEKRTRMLGLRSTKEFESSEARYRHTRIDREIQQRLSKASDGFYAALLKGDQRAEKYLNDYVTLGGDPKNLVASGKLTEAVRRKSLDYATQLMLKAKPGNRAALQSVIDYYQYYAPQQ